MPKGIKGFQKGHSQFNKDRTYFKKGEHCSPKSAHQRFHKNPNNVKPKEIIFDGKKLQRSNKNEN